MGSINFMGTYSGIDSSVVDQLIEAERAKGVKFTNQKTKIEGEKNAWKDINTRLDTLFKKMETLQKEETFQSKTVSSSTEDSPYISVSANEKAAAGKYRVQVNQLATSSRVTGTQIDVESINDPLELTDQTLTVGVGDGKKITLELTSEDSLKDVTAKINEKTKESGVTASIVDNRLILTANDMGNTTIHVEGTHLAELGLDGAEVTNGQSAEFTVDGLLITRDTNSINDVIEGVTFDLTNVHEGAQTEVITIADNTEKTVTAVKEFVDQYNSVMGFISNQLDVGDPTAEDNKTGALTGDGTVMRLQSGLRSLLTKNLESGKSGDIVNIKDIGIELDREGVATLDEEKLKEVLKENADNVSRFFYHQETVTSEVTAEDGTKTPSSKIERTGLSEQVRNFIDTYISGTTGIISGKNETYDRMLKDINEQIDLFNDRIDRKRDRYIQQFTALDVAMMQAESQMSYMYSQLGME